MAEATRRVVLGLDALGSGQPAIEIAARLAAALEADLHGLFVESTALIELATLPFAALVEQSGAITSVDRGAIERALRRVAESVRRELGQAAERAKLSTSFQVARGRLLAELRGAAGENDLVVVAGASTRPAAHGGPVLVLLEDDDARGLLELSSFAVEAGERTLIVVPDTAADATFARVLGWAERRPKTAVKRFEASTPRDLGEFAERLHARVVLASRKHRLLDESGLAELRSGLGCPLILLVENVARS